MYKWDIDEVKRTIIKYEELIDSEPSKTKREKLQETIYSFEELVEYYEMTFTSGAKEVKSYYSVTKGADYKEIVISDLSTLRDYGVYCPIVRSFTSKFVFSGTIPKIKMNNFKVSGRDIVQLNDKFYGQFKGDIREAYRELAANFRTRLQFLKLSSKYDYSGYAHPILGTNRVYIDIGLVNAFQDYISLMHESGHGVSSILNQDIMWDDEKYGFKEVDGLFFEMIGTDYAGESLHQEDEARKIKLETFNDYLYFADILCSKMDLYSAFNGQDLKDKRRVRRYFKDKKGYDKIMVDDACTTSIREYMHYIISYLTAIELYLIYQIDKEAALDLVQKIIMLKGLSISDYIEKIRDLGINPGENVKVYFDLITEGGKILAYGKKV